MKTSFNLLAILAMAVLLSACQTQTVSKPMLTDTEWILTEINGQPVPGGTETSPPTLRLSSTDRRAAGFSGINRFGTGYELEGSTLKFGMVMGTRMAGPPEAMAAEQDFLTALQSVRNWNITGQQLELSAGEKPLLRFEVVHPEGK